MTDAGEPSREPPARAGGAADDATPRLDRRSYEALLDEHMATLLLVARSAAGREHAEDVLQDAAVAGLRRLDRFEAGTDFRAWMAAIVRNTARNHLRGERRRRIHENRARERRAGGGRASGASGSQPDARSLVGDGVDPALRHAMESLGHIRRECLLLRTVQGLTYREIAAVLQIPEATARSHVMRGRAELARRLTDDPRHGERTGSPARPAGDGG